MLDKVHELINEVKAFKATSTDEIETFRIKYLGSKGLLKALFAELYILAAIKFSIRKYHLNFFRNHHNQDHIQQQSLVQFQSQHNQALFYVSMHLV